MYQWIASNLAYYVIFHQRFSQFANLHVAALIRRSVTYTLIVSTYRKNLVTKMSFIGDISSWIAICSKLLIFFTLLNNIALISRRVCASEPTTCRNVMHLVYLPVLSIPDATRYIKLLPKPMSVFCQVVNEG